MKTELLTISKIFNESIFRIPDYQRGYSWEESHLKDFWIDLEQLDSKKSHYTGVLTLEETPETQWNKWEEDVWIIRSKKYKPYYIVDGQQRLTTIIILLNCILEIFPSDEINYTPTDVIRRKYIFETKSQENIKSYIFSYEKDNPSTQFLKSEIFVDQSQGHSTNDPTIYTRNLRNAKKFFLEKLQNISATGLEEIYVKITQQLVFNAYEISKEIDVFVAFETMNNRGKPLSTLELLKNRLIYLASNIPESEAGDGKLLRKVINDSWAVIYHNLGRNEKRPLSDDAFLRTHLFKYYNTTISKELPQDDDQRIKFLRHSLAVCENPNEFLLGNYFTRNRLQNTSDAKTSLTANDLLQYTNDLRSSAEIYYKISTPSKSGWSEDEKIHLERLGRLLGHGSDPLIFSIISKESNRKLRENFLAAYERYVFCLSIRGGYQNSLRIINLKEHIKYNKSQLKIEELTTFIENSVSTLFKDNPFIDILNDWTKNGPGYYGWRSIRYFLFEYESDLQSTSKTDREKIDWEIFSKEDYQSEYITVEHIYPQRARSTYWTDKFGHLDSRKKRILRNSLGNLLALSQPKNSSLGNKDFHEKVGKANSTIGYRYGSYSENEVASFPDWNPQTIVDRGLKMLDFMEKRWQLPIGDRSQKLRALGLQFMDSSLLQKS